MNWIFNILILGIIVGIVLISRTLFAPHKTRQGYLKAMEDLFEGVRKDVPDFKNSYRICFSYEGREFEFQDIETHGMDAIIYKCFLITRASSNLTIDFTEKLQSAVKSNIIKASEISDVQVNRVNIPKKLRHFNIFTNSISKTNRLFQEDKAVDVLFKFDNLDDRGHPAMPLRVRDGVISLEYYNQVSMHPNIFDIRNNVSIIEEHVQKLAVLSRAIEAVEKERQR